ncbi:forkhead box protein D1-like [Eubalaena glacialis]|uniref:forkhead box protein D1-like n=1 Tax=Eubalaena glacialis TaxID=27606 RepID=UPI002A5ACCC3|nr:forkhead box protein D1-like [Eubalaena glacialis]
MKLEGSLPCRVAARTRRPPPPPPPPPSPPPPASAPRQRERHCRAQRAPRTGRSQGVASRSLSAPGLPRAGALAALRCGEQAQRAREVINTSGKCCGCGGGGGGGCARCQAASGLQTAPDSSGSVHYITGYNLMELIGP